LNFLWLTDHEVRPMKRYLLASDFDQTLSFNDSGIVLSELLGISGFREKSAGLSRIHLVQQGPSSRTCCCTIPNTARCARST